MIGGSFFGEWPGVGALRDQLDLQMASEPDYEARLNAARRWQKEWHFGIGVHHLRGLIDAEAAAGERDEALAKAADLEEARHDDAKLRAEAAEALDAAIGELKTLSGDRANG